MSAAAPRADFKLVLLSVQPAQAQSVVAELAEVFPIDQKSALDAVQNAPIVLISGMTQQMAANLRSHLVRLSRLGAQLRLTSDPVGKLKQLRWPALPPAVRRPSNLFVCPACGERFVVQRWLPRAAAPAAAAAVPAPAAAVPAPAPAAPAPPEAPSYAAPAPGPSEGPQPAAIPEGELVQLSAAEEELIPEAEPVEGELPEAEVIPEVDAAPAPAPASPSPPAPGPRDELAEITSFLDSILKDKGRPPAEPAPPPSPAPAPAAPAAAPAAPPAPQAPPPREAAAPPALQVIPLAPAAEEPRPQARVPQTAPAAPVAQDPATQTRLARPAPPQAPSGTAAVPQEPGMQTRIAQAAPAKPRPMELRPQSQVLTRPAVPAPPGAQPRPLVPPRTAAPVPKPAPAPPEPAGPRYDVSVARGRGPEQDALARILVERMGMPPEEAQKQCERTVVMVCKGGSPAEAEEWRKTLDRAGIKARIRRH